MLWSALALTAIFLVTTALAKPIYAEDLSCSQIRTYSEKIREAQESGNINELFASMMHVFKEHQSPPGVVKSFTDDFRKSPHATAARMLQILNKGENACI